VKPKFITFEGSEGCGKSTQIALLADWLQRHGQRVVSLREPGGTPLGEMVRHLLKHDPAGRGMAAESELLLFTASRAELARKVIAPSLAAGCWVICDRFHDSTTVYQSVARGLDFATVSVINNFALGGLAPALTLFLDLPAAAARARMLRRPRPVGQADRMESEPPEFYEKVINGYRALADREPQRVKKIAADGDKNTVFEKILTEVKHAFPRELD
jgi:dTMP kinase